MRSRYSRNSGTRPRETKIPFISCAGTANAHGAGVGRALLEAEGMAELVDLRERAKNVKPQIDHNNIDACCEVPEELKDYARKGRRMQGIYVPYWTFDADTKSSYRGERGTEEDHAAG